MDMVYAIPAVANKIFGKLFAPNGVQPRWFIEGLAVYSESKFSSGGRLRGSMFDMYMRTAALENALQSIDEVSSGVLWWPQGTTAYLYGSYFLEFLSHRCGPEKLKEISKEYASRILPFGMNKIAWKVCGETYLDLYREWKSEVEKHAKEQAGEIKKRPLSEFLRITNTAQWTQSPRWGDEGELAWYAGTMNDYPQLVLLGKNSTKERNVTRINGGGAFSFVPGKGKIVLVQTEYFRQWYEFNDLWLVDIETGEKERLTTGLRADMPDVSPDGERVAYVVNSRGNTELCISRLDDFRGEELSPGNCIWKPGNYTQISNPRWSPDSKKIAVSAWTAGGYRDLFLVDVETGVIDRLMTDRAIDMEPDFSPDGRFLYFSSDRTGIPNIFAIELSTKKIFQVTNVLTGAFTPEISKDGEVMAFVIYGHNGYDIAEMFLRPDTWFEASPYIDKFPVPVRISEKAVPESKSYNPFKTLYPRSWLPVWQTDSYGNVFGIFLAGHDIADRHQYMLELKYGVSSNAFLYDVSYTLHVIYPYITFYSGRTNNLRYGVDPDSQKSLAYREWDIMGSVIFTFPFTFWEAGQSISIAYNYEHLTGNYVNGGTENSPAWGWPEKGDLASLEVSYTFNNARRYLLSISPEEGGSAAMSLRMYNHAFGGTSDAVMFEASARKYFKVPFAARHVLALGFSCGTGAGDLNGRSLFSIGGVPDRNIIMDFINGTRAGGMNLRGYPNQSIYGESYMLLNIEYRFPIYHVERGIDLVPLYLQSLSGAVFSDCGNAWTSPQNPWNLKIGAGAEIRAEMLLGFYIPAMLRLGYGRGFSTGGVNQFYAVLGYIY